VSGHDDAQRIRRRAIYFGRVQGVFFRATARELSAGFEIVGYVKNLADGSVELEAEGPAEQVVKFLSVVADRYRDSIRDTSIVDLPARGSETEFAVH
jgi:acylphosphatase